MSFSVKLASGVLFVGTSTAGISYLIYEAVQEKNVSFFVASTNLSNSVSGIEISQDDKNKNYQCEFDQQKAFDCTISIPELDTKKNNSDINKFMLNAKSTDLTTQNLQTSGNIYKVTIDKQEDVDKIFSSNKKQLYILPTTEAALKEGEQDTKIAELDILFAMSGKKVHKETKTKYFIFKGYKEITGESNTYKCSSNGETKTMCSIYKLGENLENFVFSKSTGNSDAILKDQYYLVVLMSAQTIISSNEITSIQIQKENDNDNYGNTYSVTAAAYLHETSNNKHLFILK